MALLAESLLVEGLIGVVMVVVALYYYLTATFDYWEKRGVPFAKPEILFGSMRDQFLMRKSIITLMNEIYEKFKGNKFCGYFEARTPMLMIRDPDLVERILIKDFSHFCDRDFGAVDLKNDPLTGNLFNLKGHIWRNLRNKLTPTFTTGKLKGMIEQMCNSVEGVLDVMERVSSSDEAAEAKDLASIFSIDVIASCAFGLQFKADSPEGVQFRKISNELFGPSVSRTIRLYVVLFMQPIAKLFGFRQFTNDVNNYVINLVKSTMKFRSKNNIVRNDFFQLMMNLKAQESTGKEINWKTELSEDDAYLNHMDITQYDAPEKGIKIITDECIAAQTFVFLTAGSEAVANIISLILHEIAINLSVQKKLHQEIDRVLQTTHGEMTYDGLKRMEYLDMVIQESNRKLPMFIQRVCVAPYKIPGSDVIIEKGIRVMIPASAIHNDPGIYPEPDKFIPERFEGNNYRNSGSYLPFGDGPRVCIAMRFAILELKVCLATMLSQYSVTLDPRTISPLQFDPTSFIMVPKGGIWLKFHKRNPAA